MSSPDIAVACLRSIQGIAISLALIISFALIGRSALHEDDHTERTETNLVFYGAVIVLPVFSLLILVLLFLLQPENLVFMNNLPVMLILALFCTLFALILIPFIGAAVSVNSSISGIQSLIHILLGFSIFMGAIILFLGLSMLIVDVLETHEIFCSFHYFQRRFNNVATLISKCRNCFRPIPEETVKAGENMETVAVNEIEDPNNDAKDDEDETAEAPSSPPPRQQPQIKANNMCLPVRTMVMLSEDEQNMAVQIAAALTIV
jgi:hypothetical protein